VTAIGSSFNTAQDCAQRLLAAEAIERDYRTGELGKLVREQLKRVMPELQKKFRVQTCRAFDRVNLAGGVSYRLEEKYQVPDEQILQRAHGQTSLRKFLDEKNLIYQPGEALDVNRFVKDILPGATSFQDKNDVYTAKAVHERFLGAPGLRLIPDGGIVRQTLLKAVSEGKIVIRLADGRAYDATGVVEGLEGRRSRMSGMLTTLQLDDTVLITRADSADGMKWMKEDDIIRDPGRPDPPHRPPPGPSRATATTWEKVLEYASDRPLLDMHLIASKPAAAANLAALIQPLGAESINLSITVGGMLKDGGTANFAVSDIKLNHPTKPLSISQTIFNALGIDAGYEADLLLSFGPAGRSDLEMQLKHLSESVPEEITPRATFDKPRGAK
jgi:hypothetical protein